MIDSAITAAIADVDALPQNAQVLVPGKGLARIDWLQFAAPGYVYVRLEGTIISLKVHKSRLIVSTIDLQGSSDVNPPAVRPWSCSHHKNLSSRAV